MKKLKLAALTLCAVMALAPLAACKGGGKADKASLQIFVQGGGYGFDYIDKMAAEYMSRNTGVKVEIVMQTDQSSFIDSTILQGPADNDIDLYFGAFGYGNCVPVFTMQSRSNPVYGWTGKAWADLSDIYESPLDPAYNEAKSGKYKTIGDAMNRYYLDTLTYYEDGKQYGVPSSPGFNGLLYNKTLWDNTNARLPSGSKLELPVTTTEMFALWTRMASTQVQNASYGAYPYIYSATSDYHWIGFSTWWAQHAGIDDANLFLEGRTAANGPITADIYASPSRLEAYKIVAETMRGAGYVNSKYHSAPFKDVQLLFLQGEAFFNLNGDWLEKEMSGSFKPGQKDIRYIRFPIISDIIHNLPDGTVENDAELSALVKAIDAGSAELSGAGYGVSQADFDRVKQARRTNVGDPQYLAVVPAYSDKLAEAKDFIRFMLSKDGQQICMENTYGVRAPLEVDVTQYKYYAEATEMCKSKFELTSDWIPFLPWGQKNPAQHLGNIQYWSKVPSLSDFAITKNTPEYVQNKELSDMASGWKAQVLDPLAAKGIKVD